MKKKFTSITLALIALVTSSAFIAKYQTGIAGYTGSPGEGSCNSCHGGANSPVSGTTINAVPSFTNNEYVPGTNYTITINLAAANFSVYGFGCEILNSSNTNAGNMHTQGAGVQFLNSASRRNAIHTGPKSGTGGTSFSFEWAAPTDGDNATIYVAGNAVNGNVNTTLDFPMVPVSLALTEQVPIDTDVKEQSANQLTQLSVYPNPAAALTTISYFLRSQKNLRIELVNMNGSIVKEFTDKTQDPGPHSQILDLQGIASGVYFVKVSVAGQKSTQKLISIQ